eukprot:363543-Chlamydomonas_euryale.AAC.3
MKWGALSLSRRSCSKGAYQHLRFSVFLLTNCCKRPSQRCPPASNLVFKLLPSQGCIADRHYLCILALCRRLVDAVPSKHGLFVTAAKTESVVVGQLWTVATFKVSGKEPLVTDSDYLGSFLAGDGSTSGAMDVRNVCAPAAFCKLQGTYVSPKLSDACCIDNGYKQNI